MSIMMYMLRRAKQSRNKLAINDLSSRQSSSKEKQPSARIEEFRKMLREKTPIQKLDQQIDEAANLEQEALKPWPNNTNPHTGEIGGPKGPEPTRYGDWERKGRVTDF